MIDNTLNAVQMHVLDRLKNGKIFIKNQRAKEAKIWEACSQFTMSDHLTFAEKIRKMDNHFSSSVELSLEEINQYLSDVECLVKMVLQKTVGPCKAIKGAHKNRKKNIDKLILLFWRIPQLLPYAPIMSMLALIEGVPNIIWDNYIPSEILDNMDETEIDGKDFCDGMRIIIKEWKKSDPDYRSIRYRNHKPYFDNKTVTQDFWMMIFFMRLQQSLAHYITGEEGVQNLTADDLNVFYRDFLSIWPYSPELFFAIEEQQSYTASDWCSVLDPFFCDQDQYFYSLRLSLKRIRKCADKDSKEEKLSKLGLIENNCSGQYLKGDEPRWLVPWSPSFAARYFIDDFKLYGMLCCKDKADGYKKRILNILLEERSAIDWANESEASILTNAEIEIPVYWKKTEYFDVIENGVWREGKIKQTIPLTYWRILLGTYAYFTIEKTRKSTKKTTLDLPRKEIYERPATRYSRYMKYGKITIPPLRMAKYLGLERKSRETQDTN